MTSTDQWEPCDSPNLGDTLKWNEPLWAAPNKPRGKRDKIGEQEIIALLMNVTDVLEFKVISIKKLSPNDALLSVKENEHIKRKQSSIQKGNCHRLVR